MMALFYQEISIMSGAVEAMVVVDCRLISCGETRFYPEAEMPFHRVWW